MIENTVNTFANFPVARYHRDSHVDRFLQRWEAFDNNSGSGGDCFGRSRKRSRQVCSDDTDDGTYSRPLSASTADDADDGTADGGSGDAERQQYLHPNDSPSSIQRREENNNEEEDSAGNTNSARRHVAAALRALCAEHGLTTVGELWLFAARDRNRRRLAACVGSAAAAAAVFNALRAAFAPAAPVAAAALRLTEGVFGGSCGVLTSSSSTAPPLLGARVKTAKGGETTATTHGIAHSRTWWLPAGDVCCTGCAPLDAALRGGFARGLLHEVYGEAGTGKSQLLLQTLLNRAAAVIATAAATEAAAEEEGEEEEDGRRHWEGRSHHHTNGIHNQSSSSGVDREKTREDADSQEDVSRQQRQHAPPRPRPPPPSLSGAVVFIDCEGAPPGRLGPLAAAAAARTAQAARAAHSRGELSAAAAAAVAARVTPAAVLGRLLMRRVGSLAELRALLASAALEHVLAGGGAVLALDSIAAAAAPMPDGAPGAEARGPPAGAAQAALLAEVGARLRELTARHRLCCLVTNQVRAVVPPPPAALAALPPSVRRARREGESTAGGAGWASTAVAPALGMTWGVFPQSRVFLRKYAGGATPDPGKVSTFYSAAPAAAVREMVVLGGPALPPSRAPFSITHGGITDEREC